MNFENRSTTCGEFNGWLLEFAISLQVVNRAILVPRMTYYPTQPRRIVDLKCGATSLLA